jgi:hypothetical protein
MPDDGWPADLLPMQSTLNAMVEYGVIARRGRTWHLRRAWYTRLKQLRLQAVDTAPLAPAERPGPGLPSYSELEQWETLCCWLDGQPMRRARLPFTAFRAFVAQPGIGIPVVATDLTELPVQQLLAMRRARIVRHTSSCEWALSPTWKERLHHLWHGIARTQRERFVTQPPPAAPRLLAAGIDTWYLNWLAPEALPAGLRRHLDDLQAQANEDDEEVDTPWIYDGVPLRMYRAGVNTAQGGGVSWSYVLRDPSLTLLIRKHPLGKVIAQARLGSECLWRLTDVRALNELDTLVRRMWGTTDTEGTCRWQVSQVHLAVDVANAPIEADQLSRYVSRSRHQVIYEAARSEVERLTSDLDSEATLAVPFTVDWEAEFAGDDNAVAVYLDLEPFAGEDGGSLTHLTASSMAERASVPIEERAVTLFRAHHSLSGITWSPRGAISLVTYNKRLQGAVSSKRHMEPIWTASQGGWKPKEGATRFEVRLRRDALRELGLPNERHSRLDDPWEFLEHKQDVFAAVVGRPEADACPDATTASWIRLAVPDAHDTNRSRWPTDPLWCVVQAAPFSPSPAPARRLIRRKQRLHDVARLDVGMYGYLVSRVAHADPNGSQYDVSMAFGEAHRALQKEAIKPGKEFGELVRERRRRFGLPNPPADKVLPFRQSQSRPLSVEAGRPCSGEAVVVAESGTEAEVFEPSREPASLSLRSAELRMEEVLEALETAALRGATSREMERLEAAFASAEAAYRTAHAAGMSAYTENRQVGKLP